MPYRRDPDYEARLDAHAARFGLQRPLEMPTEEAYEDARLETYLLLGVLQAALPENPDLLTAWQRLPDPGGPWAPSILEYLIAIGVYSDRTSIAASVAFRIARLIGFGYGGLVAPSRIDPPDAGDEPVASNPQYGSDAYAAIVADYAPDFWFDAALTPQMVAAFATFWDCRYANLTGGLTLGKIEVSLFNSAGDPTQEKWERPARTLGLTPLEFFGHYLLFDPAPSDALNHKILGILNFHDEHCNEVRHEKIVPDSDEAHFAYQRRLFDREAVILDFFRTKFPFGPEMVDMGAMRRAVPLPPGDSYYVECPEPRRRAVMNGAIVEFLILVTEGDLFTDQFGFNPLFDLVNDVLPDRDYIEIYKLLLLPKCATEMLARDKVGESNYQPTESESEKRRD
jgi:hypothetical protein